MTNCDLALASIDKRKKNAMYCIELIFIIIQEQVSRGGSKDTFFLTDNSILSSFMPMGYS